MSANSLSDTLFLLLAQLQASVVAARFAERSISSAHFPVPHAIFEQSVAACEEGIDLAVDLLRKTGGYGDLNLLALTAASPPLSIFRPSDPGDAGGALRSAHGGIAARFEEIAGLVSIPHSGRTAAQAEAHAAIAAAIAGAQGSPAVG